MTTIKQDIDATLARLAEACPQTFVLEKHRPHRPLKVGIGIDLRARCPELDPPALRAVLNTYTRRVMYLEAMVAGAARIDLDGNPAGEVTARDAEYAATKLAWILASREAAAVAAKGRERVKPAAVPPSPAPPVATTLKEKPVLRLPAFQRAAR
jgi:ProP effector